MRILLIPSFVVTLLLATFADALAAATVRTPFIAADSGLACVVTNVSKKPIVVTGTLVDQVGGTLVANIDTCTPAPVLPGRTCVINAVTSTLPDGALFRGASCTIVSTSNKIRAVGYGANTSSAAVILPATAK